MLSLLVTLGGAACGSSSGSGDPDAGASPGVDAGTPDRDAGSQPPIRISGTVYAQDAPALRDGGVFPDGGAPPEGAPVTDDGRVVGSRVAFWSTEGEELDSTTTDERGEYELVAPWRVTGFLNAGPVEGYVGGLRAEVTHGSDYVAWNIVLQRREGLEVAAEQSGTEYDDGRGWMAFGFRIVSRENGGEGAELEGGVDHDDPFTYVPFDVIVTNRLPPVCLPDGSRAPGAFDGMPCTTLDRSNWIVFPNVELGLVQARLVDPPSGHCALRYEVDSSLVIADTLTKVLVDCEP